MKANFANLTGLMTLATLAVSVPVMWHSRGCRVVGPAISVNGTVIPGHTTCGDKIPDQIIGAVDNRTGPVSIPASSTTTATLPVAVDANNDDSDAPPTSAVPNAILKAVNQSQIQTLPPVAPISQQKVISVASPSALTTTTTINSFSNSTDDNSTSTINPLGCIIKGPVCDAEGNCASGSMDCGPEMMSKVLTYLQNQGGHA